MKDISATLRRIDEEINGTRQQIAALQVNIVRLEDTRRVIMGLAEADQAASHPHPGEVLLPGSHARPELIVRPTTGAGSINGQPHRAGAGKKRGRNASGELRQRILGLLQDGPMTSGDLADNLGLPRGQQFRKPMANVLYNMRKKGAADLLGSSGPGHRDGRYSLPARR